MTSEFLTKLWLEHFDGTTWIVAADFLYFSELFRGKFIVPSGTKTNLASIPWLFRQIMPVSGKYNPAAVLHDAGYDGKLMTIRGDRVNLTKNYCDLLFLEALEVAGVGKRKRKFMYEIVKNFGEQKIQSVNIISTDI